MLLFAYFIILALGAGGLMIGTRHRLGRGLPLYSPLSLVLVDERRVAQPIPTNECAGVDVSSDSIRRILVTGAAGFVGYHVAKRLRLEGDFVVGLDNFDPYYPVSLKHARQQSLLTVNVSVIQGDINNGDMLGKLFSRCNFTHVVHLAAQAGVRYARKNPMAYIKSNVQGVVSLLEVLKSQESLPILVYASSSSTYGLSKHTPFTETDKIDEPASLYAATKHSAELIVHVYHHLYGLSAAGLRFFTVYGPWGRPDMSYMMFARSIVDGTPIKIFQGPNQTELARDFTYVEDIVDGVTAALANTPASGKQTAQFRLYNLGNTHPVTVSEMVKVLSTAMGRQANVTYVPVPTSGDVMFTNANITAAADALGYAPKTRLQEGMKHFVEWYYSYYGPDGKSRAADELAFVPY